MELINMENTTELKSEATVIKLLGMALEKVEKELLFDMGGQVGGSPAIEVMSRGDGWRGVRVIMDFDVVKLYKYFLSNG
jgi:hypothetical protein